MAKVQLKQEWKLWVGIGAFFLLLIGYLYYVSRPPMEGNEYLWIVERVTDPKSLHVRGSGETMDISIVGVTIPEKGAAAAQDFLEQKLKGQWVRVTPLREVKGGRKIGQVFLSREDMTARMIRQGLALVDRDEKALDVRPYLELEQEAQKAQRGLWGKPTSGGK